MINLIKKMFSGKGNEELQAQLDAGAVIIDVRSEGEFSGGHIKGSKNIPLNTLANKLGTVKKLDKPIDQKVTMERSQKWSFLINGDQDSALKVPVYRSENHFKNFLDCIKSRKRTITPVEVAHRSQTPGHLGCIAARVGRTLKWDAVKQEIVGDPEATALLSKKMRAPWHI